MKSGLALIAVAFLALAFGYQWGHHIAAPAASRFGGTPVPEPHYVLRMSGILVVRMETNTGNTQVLNLATKEWMSVKDAPSAFDPGTAVPLTTGT